MVFFALTGWVGVVQFLTPLAILVRLNKGGLGRPQWNPDCQHLVMGGTCKSQQSASAVLAGFICSTIQPCLHPNPNACMAPLVLRDHHPAGLQGCPPASSSSPKKCTHNNYVLG